MDGKPIELWQVIQVSRCRRKKCWNKTPKSWAWRNYFLCEKEASLYLRKIVCLSWGKFLQQNRIFTLSKSRISAKEFTKKLPKKFCQINRDWESGRNVEWSKNEDKEEQKMKSFLTKQKWKWKWEVEIKKWNHPSLVKILSPNTIFSLFLIVLHFYLEPVP